MKAICSLGIIGNISMNKGALKWFYNVQNTMQELLNIDKNFIRNSIKLNKMFLVRLGHTFGIDEKFSMSTILWKDFIIFRTKVGEILNFE